MRPVLTNRLYVDEDKVPGRAYAKFKYRFKRVEEERIEDEAGKLIEVKTRFVTEEHETFRQQGRRIGFHRGDLGKLRKLFPGEWTDGRSVVPMGRKLALTKGFQYRHDQEAQLDNMVATDGGGIQIAPTGYGKTAFGIALAIRLGLRTLVLASRTNWLDDWFKDILKHTNHEQLESKFGRPPCGIIDNEFGPDTLFPCINLATFQTFWSANGKVSRQALRDSFGLIIADEASLLPAQEPGKVFTSFNPYWRVGLSADETRPDGVHRLSYDYVGPVVGRGKRQEGFSGTLIREHSGMSINAMYLYGKWLGTMHSRICKNAGLTEIVVQRVLEDVLDGYKVIIITGSRDHVVKLAKLIADEEIPVKGKKNKGKFRHPVVETLMGGDKQMDAKKARARDGQIDVLVCTNVVQMNTDIDRMDCLYDIVPAKNLQTIRQRAGRVTRAHPDKKPPRVRIFEVAVGPDTHPAAKHAAGTWEALDSWYTENGWTIEDVKDGERLKKLTRPKKGKGKVSEIFDNEDFIPRK